MLSPKNGTGNGRKEDRLGAEYNELVEVFLLL